MTGSSTLVRKIIAVFVIISISCVIGRLDNTKSHNQEREHQKKPNIIYILTDDQDEMLQSMESMPKVKRYITDRGVQFPNMFVTTPFCCSSRSSILTSQYCHNLNVRNNTIAGNCAGHEWQQKHEIHTFPTYLQNAGYKTMFAGKYLNAYGYPEVGGAGHVPAGWDWWMALIGQSYYYDYHLSINGTKVWHGNKESDYLTTIIEDNSLEFLKFADESKPFFMMLCPTAAHYPFTPLKKFNKEFVDLKAPRTPNYNHHASDKHWLIGNAPTSLDQSTRNYVDGIFRNRWRTLQSVDEMVEHLYQALTKQGIINNTIFIYSSDNGFHLGQFCFPWDKRFPYEFDIRVPLAVSGAGIVQGSIRHEPIQTIDIAPTILSLAGLNSPARFDGQSFTRFLHPRSQLLHPTFIPKKRHSVEGYMDVFSMHNEDLIENRWKAYFAVEYWGLDHGSLPPSCPYKEGDGVADCNFPQCTCQDAWNSTYTCVRHLEIDQLHPLNIGANEIFCIFEDRLNFTEYYDLKNDPFQLKNAEQNLSTEKRSHLTQKLRKLKSCSGFSCLIT